MSSSSGLAIVGGIVGFFVGGPAGAKFGWVAGSTLGSLTAAQPHTTNEGSRLSDLKVQSSAQGAGLNKIYGAGRCAGNIIWSLPIRETRTESTSSSGGGKGGGPTVTNVSYTYDLSFAVSICEGPISALRRVWINGAVVYNNGAGISGATLASNIEFAKNFTLYLGTEVQTADATVQADQGVSLTPAYRGVAYIVFSHLQLADYGNRTPNIEFEVLEASTVAATRSCTLNWMGAISSTGLILEARRSALAPTVGYGATNLLANADALAQVKVGFFPGSLHAQGGRPRPFDGVDTMTASFDESWSRGTVVTAYSSSSPAMIYYSPTSYGNAYGYIGVPTYAASTSTLVQTDTTLGAVVQDLCLQVDVTDIDVTTLTDLVPGYIRTGRATVRSSLESLAQIFFFDAVEDGATLKFVKRGAGAVVAIPEADVAAHPFGSSMPDNLQTVFLQETELPHEISVGYLEVESHYLQGMQYARRLLGNAQNTVGVTTTVALSALDARRVAEVLLWNAWMGRATFTVVVGRKYAWLKPTDVITVAKGNEVHTLRILTKQEQAGILTLSVVREDASTYTQAPTAKSMTVTSGDILPISQSGGYLLDIPILRDEDDASGFYFSAAPSVFPANWGGAQLFRSIDGGATWPAYGSAVGVPAVVGSATSALGNFLSGNIFDELNTVNVTLIGGELVSCTEIQALSGGNYALLGGEIIRFKSATLTGALQYRLSGLLRGCRGTEPAMLTHTSTDSFVLLNPNNVIRVYDPISQVGLSRDYRAVTIGSLISSAWTTSFTDTGVALKPLAPVYLRAGRDASNNITINWVRRTRVGGEWRDFVDAGLGEVSEQYLVDIMSGSTVMRTFGPLTAPTVSYSAAAQTSDFGSPVATLNFRVAQVSATVGPGFLARAQVTFP